MQNILNKRNLLILLSALVFLIICYFVEKTYLYFKYRLVLEELSYNMIVESLQIKDNISISTNKADENIVLLDSIVIKNILDNFKEESKTDNQIIYRLDNSSDVAFIVRVEENTNRENILNDEYIKVSNSDLKDFLKKNNITNDVELIDFLSKTKYRENNLFDNKEDIKNNYIINYLVSNVMTAGKTITKIVGDYEGIIINFQNAKQVNILKDEKTYMLTFNGLDYFTDEVIKDVLNSLVINGKYNNEDIPKKNFNIVIEEESNCNLKLNEYYKKDNRTIFTSCLNEINIENEENKQITLKYHLDNINQFFERSINQLVSDANVDNILKDGGTTIYKKDNYTIILCNTIDGNRDIYIGNKDFKYEQGYCK